MKRKRRTKHNRIPGYRGVSLSLQQERESLRDAIPCHARVLEVGTWHGVTVSWLADARPGCQFVSVDPFVRLAAWPKDHPQHVMATWWLNKRPNMTLVRGTIDDIERLEAKPFDFIFIDGDHTEAACYHDITIAQRILAPGGQIAVHDYDDRHPGIRAAVSRILARVIRVTGSLAWLAAIEGDHE